MLTSFLSQRARLLPWSTDALSCHKAQNRVSLPFHGRWFSFFPFRYLVYTRQSRRGRLDALRKECFRVWYLEKYRKGKSARAHGQKRIAQMWYCIIVDSFNGCHRRTMYHLSCFISMTNKWTFTWKIIWIPSSSRWFYSRLSSSFCTFQIFGYEDPKR